MAGIPVIDFSQRATGRFRAGVRAFDFMVPDFSQLRKQQRDFNSTQSSKSSDRKGADYSKSSQQFDKHAAASPTSQPDNPFFALWTTCPSWSPILKKADGWLTIVNPSGKKVPLVLGSIESCYRRNLCIGKRFGKLTNYLMIDVDRGSPFHPSNGGIQPILDAMESLGLCRYILVRSSSSEGIHIYFSLEKPVSAWGLACAAHAALTAAGVTVAAGACELFPNKKSFYAEHNGHRLPLQDGSFLLDDDFGCISNSQAVFLAQWRICAAAQDQALLAEVMAHKPVSGSRHISTKALPPIAWTAKGQSNDVMRNLANYGHEVMGHKTIQALGNWIMAIGPQLPGFEQFASRESKHDLTRRNWAFRWAKCHFKAARFYAAIKSNDHNSTVAAEALERLRVALNKLGAVGMIGIGKIWRSLSAISKNLFGVGFGWKLFQKHRQLILASVCGNCEVGLSTGSEESKSSLASEADEHKESGAGAEATDGLTKLSTPSCHAPRQNKKLSPSTPLVVALSSLVASHNHKRDPIDRKDTTTGNTLNSTLSYSSY